MRRRFQPRRSLWLESLQTRRPMAADLSPAMMELQACTPEPSAFHDVAPDSLSAESALAWQPWAPLPEGDPPQVAEGEPPTGDPQSPLAVLKFDIIVVEGGRWLLYGEVSYAGDYEVVSVDFGMDGEGLSTDVDSGGGFALEIDPLVNGEFGVVSARAISPEGPSPARYAETPF